ncbi:MAG: hypothetical protein ACK48W_02300 [Bacteroidota bacterium]|jgi:hypothetical protein
MKKIILSFLFFGFLFVIMLLPKIIFSQIRATIKLNNGIKIFANDIQGNGKDSLNVLIRNNWGSIALNEIKYISKISSKNKTHEILQSSNIKSQNTFNQLRDSLLEIKKAKEKNSTNIRFYRFAIITSNNRSINKNLLFNTLGFSLNNNLYVKQRISFTLGLGLFRLTNVLGPGKTPELIPNIQLMNKHPFISYNIGINFFLDAKNQNYLKAGFSGGIAGPNNSWVSDGLSMRTYSYYNNSSNQTVLINYVLDTKIHTIFQVENFQNIDLVFGQKIPVFKKNSLLFEFGFRKTDLFIVNSIETNYRFQPNTNPLVLNNVSINSNKEKRVSHLSFFSASLNVGFEF